MRQTRTKNQDPVFLVIVVDDEMKISAHKTLALATSAADETEFTAGWVIASEADLGDVEPQVFRKQLEAEVGLEGLENDDDSLWEALVETFGKKETKNSDDEEEEEDEAPLPKLGKTKTKVKVVDEDEGAGDDEDDDENVEKEKKVATSKKVKVDKKPEPVAKKAKVDKKPAPVAKVAKKAKVDKKPRVRKGGGVVQQIKIAVLGNLKITADELLALLAKKGLESNRSSVSGIAAAFRDSLRVIAAGGFKVPTPD